MNEQIPKTYAIVICINDRWTSDEREKLKAYFNNGKIRCFDTPSNEKVVAIQDFPHDQVRSQVIVNVLPNRVNEFWIKLASGDPDTLLARDW